MPAPARRSSPTRPDAASAEGSAPWARKAERGVRSPDATDASGDVRSVRRALTLLSLFDAELPGATLSELARRSGLATSTVQRLLQTLERERFVGRDEDGTYAPGPALLRLGLLAVRDMPLRERAGPYLARLSAETSETVNLGVLDELGRALYVRSIPSPRPIRHEGWLGRPFAPRGTALGRALAGDVDARGRYLTRTTQEPDVSAASAPILGPDGTIVAGFSVTGPSYRIDDAELERIADCAATAARELSLALGATWRWEAPRVA